MEKTTMKKKTSAWVRGESRENYLKAIYQLCQTRPHGVHYVELEEQFGYTKSSVCKAVLTLKEEGYVSVNRFHCILLTEEGEKLARLIYRKYEYFKQLLLGAGVEESLADQEACKLEHGISDESLEKLTGLSQDVLFKSQ